VPLSPLTDELLQVPVPQLPEALYPILVFDCFDGPTLQQHYSTPRYASGFDFEEFYLTAISLASIVASIHSHQYIHRDITSSNILYQPKTREVRLIDFGISSAFPNRSNPSSLVSKQLQGTLQFLSPEQTGRIGRIVDHRTDLFSLGCVLYQMLTGVLPITLPKSGGDIDSLQIVHSILTKVPPTPHQLNPSIPLVLSNIVMRCIEKSPDDRYLSAFGLSVDLRSCSRLRSTEGATTISSSFELGVWDEAAVFSVSKKLYGCESFVAMVQRSLDMMLKNGRTHVVAIRGAPGSGTCRARGAQRARIRCALVTMRSNERGGSFH
jgi:serine/threonine protein kinase